MRYFIIPFIVSFLGVVACTRSPQLPRLTPLTTALVDSITTVAQQALGSTLMKHVAANGAIAALELCNHKALPITDSVASTYNVSIQRISEKNRNPNNELQTSTDRVIWQAYLNNEANGIIQKTDENGKTVFYKPIKIAMETCLNCHGNTETINPRIAKKIKELYPNDKATGFSMNDLRGMWKVTQN